MSTKANRKHATVKPNQFNFSDDSFDDEVYFNFEEDFDVQMSLEDEWFDDPSSKGICARRKIERKRERDALRSELSDWESFGLKVWD